MGRGCGSFSVTRFLGVGGCRAHPTPHITTPKAAPSLSPPTGMQPAHGSGSPLSPTRGLQGWLNLWCFTSSPEPGPCSAASAEERSRFSGGPHA